jgi:hypothetical protein
MTEEVLTTLKVIYYMIIENEPFYIGPPNYQNCVDFDKLKEINKIEIEKMMKYENIPTDIYTIEYKIYQYELILHISFKWQNIPNLDLNSKIACLLNGFFQNNNDNHFLNFQNKKIYMHKIKYYDTFSNLIQL